MDAILLNILAGVIGGTLIIISLGLAANAYNIWREFKREDKYYKTMNGPKT